MTPRVANHRVPILPVAVPLEAAIQANRANPTASPIAVRQQAADQAQVAIPPRVAQAAIHRVVHRANHQSASLVQTLPVAIHRIRHRAVRTANPVSRLIPVLMIQVPTIQSHPIRTVCLAYRAAISHRANPILVIPSRAIPNRVNRIQAIQIRHRVNRIATVNRRRIRAIQRQATRVDRAQAIVIRAGVIPAIVIPKVRIANHRAIRKANLIRIAGPSAPASLNLRVIARVNRKANPNRRAALIANRILAAIPTVLADPATPAADLRATANQGAQVLPKAPPIVPVNRPATANRRAKAKIQVAIDPHIAPAIIRAIATQQVIIHQVVHPTARRIAIPKAIRIQSHQILTHLTVVAQAHRIRSHQANHRQEVPAAVALARGSGHAAGSCSIRTAKVLNHPRALVATTER